MSKTRFEVVDRRAAAGRTGLHNFVTGRKNGDTEAASYRKLGQPERGGERHVLHFEDGAERKDQCARSDIFACQAPVPPKLQALGHGHVFAVGHHIFLHENRVSAPGHRGTGEDADCAARLERQGLARPCGQPARYYKRRVCIRPQVRVPHGITINGRIVERREIDGCLYVCR